MANEAVCIETPTIFERKTIAAGAVIPIGTIMNLSSDPNTVTASSGADLFGGIAWEESTATNTFTELTVAMNGIWDIKNNAGEAITLGGMVSLSGANLIKQADAGELLTGAILGKCQESAAVDEVVRVAVGSLA